MLNYFTEDELKCKGTGVCKLAKDFGIELDYIRKKWGKPLTLTSACRSPEHNEAVSGREGSFHLTENPKYNTGGCCAVDIFWERWKKEDKDEFVTLALDLDWSVGLAKTFVHIDRRVDYTEKLKAWWNY